MMKKRARLVAILILVMAVIAPVGMMIIPAQLFVEGDAQATAANIAAHAGVFRLGITCDAVICLLEIAISVLLLRLFEPAGRSLALTATASRLAMTVIQGMNVVVYLSLLHLVNLPETAQAGAWTSLLLSLHTGGVYMWQVFFGLHLLTLGVLAYRSGYLPRLVSVALIVASSGYWADSFAGVWGLHSAVAQGVVAVLLVVSTLGELLFAGWLLVKGVRHSPAETAKLAPPL